MNQGYIKLFRKLKDSDFWLHEKFSRPQAWVDLILLANRFPGSIRKRGVRVFVGVGEVGWSEVALAERWKWSRGKVRRFLSELETEQKIVQQKNNVSGLIKIIKFEYYQTGGTANDTANGTTNGQQTDSKRYRNKKEKKEKNKKTTIGKNFKIEIPDWLPKKSWEEFVQHRIEIKKPMTELSAKKIISKLEKFKSEGCNIQEIINLSIENSWQGVFKPKTNAFKSKSDSGPVYREIKPTDEDLRKAGLL